MKYALKFLKKAEWTAGNGQCSTCWGHAPRRGWWTPTVGHKKTCELAKAIESIGGKVVWECENRSKTRFDFEKYHRAKELKIWGPSIFKKKQS